MALQTWRIRPLNRWRRSTRQQNEEKTLLLLRVEKLILNNYCSAYDSSWRSLSPQTFIFRKYSKPSVLPLCWSPLRLPVILLSRIILRKFRIALNHARPSLLTQETTFTSSSLKLLYFYIQFLELTGEARHLHLMYSTLEMPCYICLENIYPNCKARLQPIHFYCVYKRVSVSSRISPKRSLRPLT